MITIVNEEKVYLCSSSCKIMFIPRLRKFSDTSSFTFLSVICSLIYKSLLVVLKFFGIMFIEISYLDY